MIFYMKIFMKRCHPYNNFCYKNIVEHKYYYYIQDQISDIKFW